MRRAFLALAFVPLWISFALCLCLWTVGVDYLGLVLGWAIGAIGMGFTLIVGVYMQGPRHESASG